MSIAFWIAIIWVMLIILVIFMSRDRIRAIDDENIGRKQLKQLQEILEDEGIEKHQ